MRYWIAEFRLGWVGLLLLGMSPLEAEPANQAERPMNILLLISDDQRRDSIGALGNPEVITPHLDWLVRHGTSFDRNYCMGSFSGAVCAPSRAMLMTGRTLWQFEGNIFNMKTGSVLMPELFRQAGYRTFGTGKWHNGREWFHRAFTDGDAIFFGGMGDHLGLSVHSHDPEGKYGEETERKIEKFSSTVFADAAVEFLESAEEEDRPFFAYVSFTAPHDPRMAPELYEELYDPEAISLPANYLSEHPFDNGDLRLRDEQLAPWPRTPEVVREHLAAYYAMITQMDAQIGRILDALRNTGRADNTLIVFTSDHGLGVGSHGLMGKQNLYEHSMGAPLIFVGPGIDEGRRVQSLVYLLDLFPTLCDWVGLNVPPTVEGKSLVPLLRGEQRVVRSSVYLAYKDVQRAVVTDRWKLVQYPKVGETQLFDLLNDPEEVHNFAGLDGYHNHVTRLENLLHQWQIRLDDPVLQVQAQEPEQE